MEMRTSFKLDNTHACSRMNMDLTTTTTDIKHSKSLIVRMKT